MRYLYSVIRFVPDSARGEFINLAVLAVSDESGEWELRQAGNFQRANSLDREAAQGAAAWLADLAGDLDEGQLSFDDLAGARTEAWLHALYRTQRNIIQLSEPRPMVARSVGQAVDQLFDIFVVDPERRSRETRQEAISQLRDAYLQRARLQPHLTLHERVQVQSGGQSAEFDFAVANGSLAQLARTWTLAVRQPQAVIENIRAWGYTVHRIRDHGASLIVRDLSAPFAVPPKTPIRVLYVPPNSAGAERALETARDVWLDLGVRAYPLGAENEIAAEVADIGRHDA